MILCGEDIGISSHEKFNHFRNCTMTRDIALHLLSFYQEQNLLLLSASA